MFLPDVNFWLALSFSEHVHHSPAAAWFHGARGDSRCSFCRMTQQGFLRIANNPKALPRQAVGQADAWLIYDQFLAHPAIDFVGEPPSLEASWRKLTQGQQFSPHFWNDAYLAAFAQAGGYEIVTFDKGFHQFPGLACLVLS